MRYGAVLRRLTTSSRLPLTFLLRAREKRLSENARKIKLHNSFNCRTQPDFRRKYTNYGSKISDMPSVELNKTEIIRLSFSPDRRVPKVTLQA